jgi:hypothetical protein
MNLRLRPLISLLLVLVSGLLINCTSVTAAQIPDSYSPSKIEQIQLLADPLKAYGERLKKLGGLIDKKKWVDTRTLIHGPLGRLRQDLRNISDNLLPQDQVKAKALAKDIFAHFEKIDAAAKARNANAAVEQFQGALKDFNDYFNLLPS